MYHANLAIKVKLGSAYPPASGIIDSKIIETPPTQPHTHTDNDGMMSDPTGATTHRVLWSTSRTKMTCPDPGAPPTPAPDDSRPVYWEVPDTRIEGNAAADSRPFRRRRNRPDHRKRYDTSKTCMICQCTERHAGNTDAIASPVAHLSSHTRPTRHPEQEIHYPQDQTSLIWVRAALSHDEVNHPPRASGHSSEAKPVDPQTSSDPRAAGAPLPPYSENNWSVMSVLTTQRMTVDWIVDWVNVGTIFVFGGRHSTKVMGACLGGDPVIRPSTSRGRWTGGPLTWFEILLLRYILFKCNKINSLKSRTIFITII